MVDVKLTDIQLIHELVVEFKTVLTIPWKEVENYSLTTSAAMDRLRTACTDGEILTFSLVRYFAEECNHESSQKRMQQVEDKLAKLDNQKY